MRKAIVNCKGILAGNLEEKTTGFQFEYDDKYLASSINKAISLKNLIILAFYMHF